MRNKYMLFCMLLISLFACAMEQDDLHRKHLEQLKRLSANHSLCAFAPENRILADPAEQIKLIYQAKKAIQEGNEAELKKILLPGGIDFSRQENQYTSASFALLLWSVKMRRPEMCELLLQAGADVNASSIEHQEGNNVLSQTIFEAHLPRCSNYIPEICSILLRYGAQINRSCYVAAWGLNNKEINELLMQVPESAVFAQQVADEVQAMIKMSE